MSFLLASNTGGASIVITDRTLTGDGTFLNPLSVAPLLTDGVTVLGDGINIPLSATFNQSGRYLISGGIAWSGAGYTYDVSVLKFVLDGITYGPVSPNPSQVTMVTADPTNDRFDAVVVDSSGNVSVITGTPSDDPAYPTIPDDKVAVGYVLVTAASTQPTILSDNIYIDNNEWVVTSYTTGSGSTGSVNPNSTTSPKQGSKCIGIISNPRLGVKFTRATAIDVQQFTYLQIWYRNDTTLLNTKVPYVRFDNSLGNPVGNTVNLLNYGISRTVVGTWQLAQIPISAFGSISLVKGLRAIITGGTLAQQAQWSLDYMLVSGGLLPQGALGPIYLSPSNTLYSTNAAGGATGVQNSQFFGNLAGFQATAADFSIFEGYATGYSATSAYNSIMLGDKAGFKAANSNNVQFIGSKAGYGAINADNSQFIGTRAGYAASSAYSSTFFGTSAGDGATNAYQSSFIGRETGRNAINASDAAFFGYQAGDGATNASNSFFMGPQAGQGAVDATGAVFIGAQAGQNSASLGASIFIGQQSGQNSTSTAPNILIGAVTSDGGFDNVIVLGTTATATANNQLMIGSVSLPINHVVVNGTGAIQVPVGTTSERIATQGAIRYNTTTGKFEGYDGSTWVNLN